MKQLFLCFAVFSVCTAVASPKVSNVAMIQGADRNVTVTYDLADEDAIVTLSIETNGVALAESEVSNLAGDVNKVVSAGAGKTIVWRACKSWPNHKVDNARARVTAWSKNYPPLYAVFDLTKGGAANASSPWPVRFYTTREGIPGGETDIRYKTTHLLMRRVDPTDDLGFVMGASPYETGYDSTREHQHTVHLTQPYYLGVYEVTQGQGYYMFDDVPPVGGECVPKNGFRWYLMHGNCLDWPFEESKDTGTGDALGQWIRKLRARSAFLFDLPTEAQWEYACRAGTTTAFNNGSNDAASMDELGLYAGNKGDATGPGDVGRFAPNDWGFYDMHGNVMEWVFDRQVPFTSAEATDPTIGNGAAASWNRVLRGGCYDSSAADCRSGSRRNHAYIDRAASNSLGSKIGVRLMMQTVAP